MSEQDEDTDKSFDPTPQKLLDARKKGEIAKSAELQPAASYAGLPLAFLALGFQAISGFAGQMQVLLDQASEHSDVVFAGGPSAVLGSILWNASWALIPIFLLPALAVTGDPSWNVSPSRNVTRHVEGDDCSMPSASRG